MERCISRDIKKCRLLIGIQFGSTFTFIHIGLENIQRIRFKLFNPPNFRVCAQQKVQAKRFKICHILIIQKPKVVFSVFHVDIDQGIH